RFLESRGRTEEAEQVVRSFEASAGIDAAADGAAHDAAPRAGAGDAAEAGAVAAAEVPEADRIDADGGIWSRPLRARTAEAWAVWVCISLCCGRAFIWVPTLLVERVFDLTRSGAITLLVSLAQSPGYAVAAWLIAVRGRRWPLTVCLAGSAVGAAC